VADGSTQFDFCAPLPGHVHVDDMGDVSMEWYFGKQGHPDSWRILLIIDSDGVHVFGMDLKGEINSQIASGDAALVRLRELLQRAANEGQP
jgi:hypothetical protein